MIIVDNYLLLVNTKEFSSKITKYFYDRLQLFLSITDKNCPKIIFTQSKSVLEKAYGKYYLEGEPSRAFYDDESETIFFNAEKYRLNSEKLYINREDIQHIINTYDFKYIIPLSDIYHEMIHHLQYYYSDYKYTDFIEAIADIYSYCITGQWNIDYLNESIGFYRVCTEILEVKPTEFYVMLRDAIVDKNFFKNYFYDNRRFVYLLGKNYNGKLGMFLHNFKKDYGNREYENNFYMYIKRIHDLIFYKY
jgi:hypothetical protein